MFVSAPGASASRGHNLYTHLYISMHDGLFVSKLQPRRSFATYRTTCDFGWAERGVLPVVTLIGHTWKWMPQAISS